MNLKLDSNHKLQPWEVIQKLGSDNSRLFKESVILGEIGCANHIFFHGCRYPKKIAAPDLDGI